MSETTVFQSGNSQAVRLPKEFRFSTKTVEIFRRGDEVVLREKRRTLAEALAKLPPISDVEAADFAATMEQIRRDQPPLQERDWGQLVAAVGPTAQPRRRNRK